MSVEKHVQVHCSHLVVYSCTPGDIVAILNFTCQKCGLQMSHSSSSCLLSVLVRTEQWGQFDPYSESRCEVSKKERLVELLLVSVVSICQQRV